MEAWISHFKDWLVRKYHRLVQEISWLCGKPVLYSGKVQYGCGDVAHEPYNCLSPDDDGCLVYRLREDSKLVRLDLTEDQMSLGHSNRARFTVEDANVDAEHVIFFRQIGEDGCYRYYVRNISARYPVYIANRYGKTLCTLSAVAQNSTSVPNAARKDNASSIRQAIPAEEIRKNEPPVGSAVRNASKTQPSSSGTTTEYELHSGDLVVMSGFMVLFLRRSAEDNMIASFASILRLGTPFSRSPAIGTQTSSTSLWETAQPTTQSLMSRKTPLSAQMEVVSMKSKSFP